jgi:hypothetical protein
MPTKRQLERSLARVHLQAEAIAFELIELQELSLSVSAEIQTQLEAVLAANQRLRQILNGTPVGVLVSEAAARLEVSVPTVKKWVRLGLLDAAVARHPTEITANSLLRVEHAINKTPTSKTKTAELARQLLRQNPA